MIARHVPEGIWTRVDRGEGAGRADPVVTHHAVEVGAPHGPADRGSRPAAPLRGAAPGAVPRTPARLIVVSLGGAVRIGILREAYERDSLDPEVARLFETAIDDLRRGGAEIPDVRIEGLAGIQRAEDVGPCIRFRYDIERYPAPRGDLVPVLDLQEIPDARSFHPSVETRIRNATQGLAHGLDSAECAADESYRERVHTAVRAAMREHRLDGFVHPTWSNIPRLIDDLNTPAGDSSQFFSPTTGFPAISVPIGFVRGVYPAGTTLFGRPWEEATLIRIAHAYEQATRHRRPPASTPPVR